MSAFSQIPLVYSGNTHNYDPTERQPNGVFLHQFVETGLAAKTANSLTLSVSLPTAKRQTFQTRMKHVFTIPAYQLNGFVNGHFNPSDVPQGAVATGDVVRSMSIDLKLTSASTGTPAERTAALAALVSFLSTAQGIDAFVNAKPPY